MAEKIRKAVAAHDFGEAGPQTASFGVGEYARGRSMKEIFTAIDNALYMAKENGRNRVEVSEFRPAEKTV